MSNQLYPKFKQALQNKEHNMDSDNIIASLVRKSGTDTGGTYTYSAAHTSKTDLGTTVADSAALGTTTITDGVFDSADFSWTAVTAGNQVSIVALWNDTPTTPTADPLVVHYDTGMTGMPVTPNGGNINFTVHASGWYALITVLMLQLQALIA
jgi:hypothetical protein